MTTFWNTATQEQKLAQIDGGIECGMNSHQIAMNCGCTTQAIWKFATVNGRNFAHVGAGDQGVLGKAYAAERRSVEMEKRIAARTGSIRESAFSIFDHQPESLELEWPA